MDFYRIKERLTKSGTIEVYPDFRITRSKDLMIRGKSFYAIWDESRNLWSTDEYDVQRIIDKDLSDYREDLEKRTSANISVKYLNDFSSNSWLQFRNYINHLSDSSHQLDEKLTFANTEVKKSDYVSRKLSYPLEEGPIEAWNEIVGTLYDEEQREKIEWAIGCIISGDSVNVQKFIVLYGSAGTGKSTILNIIQQLFDGYYTTFEAKALTSTNNAFSTEVFKSNPLVAIQHDGDLSKIEDNTKLNSIVSHEYMTLNEKYKPSYTARINAFLFMGSNKAVKITDSKSGLIRRLIDVHPSGNRIPAKKYQALMSQIPFELGGIATHCLDVYRNLGKDYYSGYKPIEMMLQTDAFFNYIEAFYDVFKSEDGITLNRAYDLYKTFCEESNIEYKLSRFKFREELRNYFQNFEEKTTINGELVRSWYSGFIADKFKTRNKDEKVFSLVLDSKESLLDKLLAECPAQYSKDDGTPQKYWSSKERIGSDGKPFTPKPNQVVKTVLSDLDTTKEHYVKPPANHIVIDFDLKDKDGNKSAERNLEAASSWPSTYAEFSKSGAGIHLHYTYTGGNPADLSRVYDDGIEIKVFTGDSSLRRRLTACNTVPVASINSGLPIKEKKVINSEGVKSEKALRNLILRNLRKEIHAATKPSVDFISKILNDAYNSGLSYDVTDMRNKILAFASNSTNNSLYCIKLVQAMPFKSEDQISASSILPKDERLVFFDVEVFPNLFLICWKYEGNATVVRMFNPTPQEVEKLMAMKLVGFNCRRYDNHILYARYMGYSNEQLYKLSQDIINNKNDAFFGAAYNISYTDIFDFVSLKQSLKQYEIDLGIHHQELGLPWDKPVPKELWEKVAEYCENDVVSTEAVFNARKEDFIARQILADLSGLTVNDKTQNHLAKIVFGDAKNAKNAFVYTDLSEEFPGYTFEFGKSSYMGEDPSEGGYVYSKPGIYKNVALLDIASLHPTTIERLNLFGEYTKNFSALKNARIAIKHHDYDTAKSMLGGKLARYLGSEEDADALAYALKIVINIAYGLTSAKYPNPFNDPRNVDNIVAKRGALFMIKLKHAVEAQGYEVVHIKTDSIKIPNATKKIIDFVMEFGDEYGYTFEHEATYKKLALVNKAVYIAKVAAGRKPEHWEAVGAQFKHPYVFKTLFSKEPIEFKDLCEAKHVETGLYLDFSVDDSEYNDKAMALLKDSEIAKMHDLHFVGKVGLFTPIKPSKGGGLLLRENKGAYEAVNGSKGYFWMESEMVKELHMEKDIDMAYFNALVDQAVETISKYGDFEEFVS